MNYALRALFNFSFKGRARRAEYWWFAVLLAMIGFVLRFISFRLGWVMEFVAEPAYEVPAEIVPLGPLVLFPLTLVQSVALFARRLHDINASAWWLLFIAPWVILGPAFGLAVAIPVGLSVLAITLIPGTRGANKFGEDPKAVERGS